MIRLAMLALSLVLCGLLLPPLHAAELGSEIRSKTLDNGLKVIVWPDHDIPNAVLYNWVRAGARNERPGITGLSHFFEHMMFNGAKKYGPGEFDRVMEANPEMQESLRSFHPIGRFGTPEEVAESVLWLCSEESSFVVGCSLPVDGGFRAK